MAYDTKTDEMVLLTATGPTQTWVFDPASKHWVQRFPANSPQLTFGGAAYDARTGLVVLVGSVDGSDTCTDSVPAQTWTWDGTNWTQQHPHDEPGECQAVSATSTTYDPATGQVIMQTSEYDIGIGDTWRWNGTDWGLVARGAENPAIGYDPQLHRLVAYGGSSTNLGVFEVYGGTSTWNGWLWVPLHTTGSPPRLGNASMTDFVDLHTVIMFGGQTYDANFDPTDTKGTWYLDHTRWIRIHTKTSPPPTHSAGFVYDTAHHFALLHATRTWLLSP